MFVCLFAPPQSGLTPLHVAAFMGNINIVMYLIKNGGGVDETNVVGFFYDSLTP